VVQFKGREMQHKELGRDLLQKIYQPIEDIAAMESPPKVPSKYYCLLNCLGLFCQLLLRVALFWIDLS
jgi:translation initiation factor IF-3